MTDNAIVPLNQIDAVNGVKVLAAIVRELRESVFIEDQDYGKIPGTGDKPVLLLPGMEKLMRALRLRAEYALLTSKEDFDTPLFFYRYECRMVEIDTGAVIATANGSANSHESKWRWRDAKRVCPKCGSPSINRSKYPPKGAPRNAEAGWYCYAKVGGCGAEFAATDPAITTQTIGRVENPDIADQVNTIDKIAQKRALSSAIKGAANVSEFFTVDLEDMPTITISRPAQPDVIDGEYDEVKPAPLAPTTAAPAQPAATPTTPATVTHIEITDADKQFETLFAKNEQPVSFGVDIDVVNAWVYQNTRYTARTIASLWDEMGVNSSDYKDSADMIAAISRHAARVGKLKATA